jgi:hypothetical protein
MSQYISEDDYEALLSKLDEVPDVSCDCKTCKSMCIDGYPCRPTPDEADILLDNGFAKKMCLEGSDVFVGDEYESIQLVKPAIAGKECKSLTGYTRGDCVMLDAQNHCILHAKGLKPVEGRKASCSRRNHSVDVFDTVKELWFSKRGEEVIARWKKMVKFKD